MRMIRDSLLELWLYRKLQRCVQKAQNCLQANLAMHNRKKIQFLEIIKTHMHYVTRTSVAMETNHQKKLRVVQSKNELHAKFEVSAMHKYEDIKVLKRVGR